MCGQGPEAQEDEGEEAEPDRGRGLSVQTEPEPLQELSEIVWTRDITVEASMGYHITSVFLFTETFQDIVRLKEELVIIRFIA